MFPPVYHLSAQFPGPTAPRDFVTLLLTSGSALQGAESEPSDSSSRFSVSPRHYIVISRPCDHPETPPRDGFVRGQYESVEFIREIAMPKPRKSLSVTDLSVYDRHGESLDREAILRNANEKPRETSESLPNQVQPGSSSILDPSKAGRSRGKTISFAGSRGHNAKGEKIDSAQSDDDDNPVEWVMITRSAPGGGIPRFMVDRGTPGSIVADAGKFVDWAARRQHSQEQTEASAGELGGLSNGSHAQLEQFQTNGHLAGIEEDHDPTEEPSANSNTTFTDTSKPVAATSSEGLLSTVTHAAYSGLETYAPQVIVDRLPAHQKQSMSDSLASTPESGQADGAQTPIRAASTSSLSSIGTFVSVDAHFEDGAEDLPAYDVGE